MGLKYGSPYFLGHSICIPIYLQLPQVFIICDVICGVDEKIVWCASLPFGPLPEGRSFSNRDYMSWYNMDSSFIAAPFRHPNIWLPSPSPPFPFYLTILIVNYSYFSLENRVFGSERLISLLVNIQNIIFKT